MTLFSGRFLRNTPYQKGRALGKSLSSGKWEEKTLDSRGESPDCSSIPERPCGIGRPGRGNRKYARADSWMGQTGSGRDRASILQGDAPAEEGSASGDPGKG